MEAGKVFEFGKNCHDELIISDNAVYAEDDIFGREINGYIDKRIKELKGEK